VVTPAKRNRTADRFSNAGKCAIVSAHGVNANDAEA
jgi:hypothetical protein